MPPIAPSEIDELAPDAELRGSIEKAKICRGLGMADCRVESQGTKNDEGEGESCVRSSQLAASHGFFSLYLKKQSPFAAAGCSFGAKHITEYLGTVKRRKGIGLWLAASSPISTVVVCGMRHRAELHSSRSVGIET